VFILENVPGFVEHANGEYVQYVLRKLRSIKQYGKKIRKMSNYERGEKGEVERVAEEQNTEQNESPKERYEVKHCWSDTQDNGLPQSRKRWYCVGILRSCLKSTKPIQMAPQD